MNDIKYLFKDKLIVLILLGAHTLVIAASIAVFSSASSVTNSLIIKLILSAVPIVFFTFTLWGSLLYSLHKNN